MDYDTLLNQVVVLLQQEQRLSYRVLKRRLQLDDELLEDLKEDLIYAKQLAVDEAGKVLVWTGAPGPPPGAGVGAPAWPETRLAPALDDPAARRPITYTPRHLAERILAEQQALEARGAPDGERKTITALFADIKGSMDLLEDVDPEDARHLIDPALTLMMAAVHRYEGYVAQSLGDGIFALFGAPIAHEDHAQRALYAALRMQEEMRRYADRVQLERGLPLQIRVGLNTGEVVVRSIRTDDLHTDYVPIGHATSLAARLQSLADPGSIVISESTFRLTDGFFAFKALGAAQIKGVSEPVPVYEVAGVGPLRTRLQVAASRGLMQFVGRQRELELMQQAWEQAKRGQGQIVAAVGEPGVGKSRLFYEFKLQAQRHGLVLETFSVSHGKAYPYLPLIALLNTYFQLTPQDDDQRRREQVTGKVLTLDRRLEDTLPYVAALVGVEEAEASLAQFDPQLRRRRTFEAITQLLLRESLNQPVLLMVEDLHWLDSETQAWLSLFSDRVATARLLLLVNYRPEFQHTWGSKTYYSQLRLDPLGPEEAHALLTALLGDHAALQPLKPFILAKTAGNPFFMEEMVQTLVDQGVLRRNPAGGMQLVSPVTSSALAALQLPPTVQGVLAARIDRLPAEEKALLQTLAVLGKEFAWSLLTQVTDQPDEELQWLLAHLQAEEFIYEQPAFPESAYIFKHALTQEVAYNAVLLERRRAVHERAAQAIEGLFAERLPEHYHTLAHHYRRSGNTAKAVDYLHRAGHQAVERSAYTEAISHLTAALDLLTTLPETREHSQQELTVQMTLGIALRATKGSSAPEVEQLNIRARELCEQVGEPPQLFRVLWGFWLMYNGRGEYQTMRALGEQLLSLAQRLEDPDLLLEAHHALWTSLFNGGELAAARMHQEQGLRLYDPLRHRTHAALYSGHDPGVCCRYRAAPALWLLGYPDQAVASSQAALALAQQLAHPYSLTQALYWAAVLHHLRREVPLTQAHAEAAMTIATDQGFQQLAGAMPLRGWALTVSGHGEEGITRIRLAVHRATRATRDRTYHLALLAEASAQVGQTAEGLEAVTEALTTLGKTGVRWWEAELYRLRGELLLQHAVAQPEEAEACFQQALDIARRQQAKSLELRAAMSLSRLWQRQGKRDAARELLAPIYGWFTEGFDTADLQEARGLLDELGGDTKHEGEGAAGRRPGGGGED
jgi:predicted ATPase/class 3 adenylate cyclase